jgi:hypothetical protein
MADAIFDIQKAKRQFFGVLHFVPGDFVPSPQKNDIDKLIQLFMPHDFFGGSQISWYEPFNGLFQFLGL